MDIRAGQGIDFHRLEKGIDLRLGGVLIPYEKGCVAHSDGDVLLHAICDALLGAAGLRDIGMHFPDSDPEYRNIDSRILLKRTFDLISREGYSVINVDSTICLEKPRISARIPEMKEVIAGILKTQPGNISVKATTTEGMGFTGRGEGVMATAMVLLRGDDGKIS
ncbi:MAG: 2-C-methyl-D-erythritol 2,4-cyclodiphosphate synthase [Bacteroidales bacterium]|jgi:2-C-methyl-D-erythritol 2,4-cyclodiphosphate synthase|nr:2-C-methyl-D-erythritol 2,4-cyclodiphosphate synthase [Bacteroidales bacterium]